MVSLLQSPHITTELHSTKKFMEVSEALPPRFHFHFINNYRTPNLLIGPERYTCRHTSLTNVFRFALSVGTYSSIRSHVMSAKKDHSISSCGELCTVVWTVEADLTAGQLLYITGEPISLGSWQPDLALLMSPTEHANLWTTEVKIPSGTNYKYNYFIKEEKWPSDDVIWRPGPQFSLSVPLKRDGKIMVRDSWLKYKIERSLPDLWGSWLGETYPPAQPLVSARARDEHQTVNNIDIDLKETKTFLNDLKFQNESFFVNKHKITAKDDHQNMVSSERDQPIEEPWLLQSSITFIVPKDNSMPIILKNNGSVTNNAKALDVCNQHLQAKDKSSTADGNNIILEDDSVSTIILINSSICTMQRIAVLEGGKLVELLLEPVKTNVQCDSVYLGVVTKFVPHMGGAFVNIGHSRPSLMDIKQNREPFIFPPFRQMTTKGNDNVSGLDSHEEQQAADRNEHVSQDVEDTDDVAEFISQEDLVPFSHDDHEDHEADEDFDIPEGKENADGSMVDNVQIDTKIEQFLDGREHHLEAESMNMFASLEKGMLNGSLISHPQYTKDSEHLPADGNKWIQVRKGTKIVVQVVKEGLGTKGPTLTAYPKLRSRFWILHTQCDRIGISKKISGIERTRLRVIAKTLQPPGFGLTVRTVAAGHSLEELHKDLEGLLSNWKNILEHAKSASLAADEGIEGAIPVLLHRAMGQTLSVVQDYFNERVKEMVVDSPRTYHEVTNYLQEIAPDLCDRVELYGKKIPLFDEYKIEEEINNILSKRVPLPKGGSLVIEQTEALVSIDVNGGHVMFGHATSQEKAVLDVNLEAAKQIARELRLRDIGGIIVVDFIDMADDSNKRLVYEEMKRAVEGDRSTVKVSELSKHGLMEITRKRVRPSVTFMISEPCSCCHATGRVEALETSFSNIEQEICRLLATMNQRADPEKPKTWPRFLLRVDHHMCNYLTSGKRTRLAVLSSSLKVWILLKVARGFTRGAFELKPFTDGQANESQHQIAISVLRQTETTRTINSNKKVTLVPVKKGKSRDK